ncbi:hypothetical protein NGM10_00915 [Halorussus salilacus]|uniref:hypothetical protein n=1 Tax=Halorussus salilacus TaxID=2953750 RepID=UPI0020A13F06|nr:hypothetical protein [Halorussus salilacus]USZ68317.1 hypothetical protein NGM10_00915 [Halorussus salilacus]
MRIEATATRKRKWENLKEATGKGHKSTALDTAAEYYLKMAGDTTAVPVGAIEELMELAVEEGSVTPEEIADVLDTEQLHVQARTSWSVGNK